MNIYVIGIIVLLMIISGVIVTIVLLSKKKNDKGGGGGGGGNQTIIQGCPYNNSTLEAPLNNVIQISGNYAFKCNNLFISLLYNENKDYFITLIEPSQPKDNQIIYYNSFTQQLEHDYNGDKYYLDIKDPCCGNICGNQSSTYPECVSGNLYWTKTSTSKFVLSNNSIYSVDAKAYIVPNEGDCKVYTNSGCGVEGNCINNWLYMFQTLTFSTGENGSKIWDINPTTT